LPIEFWSKTLQDYRKNCYNFTNYRSANLQLGLLEVGLKEQEEGNERKGEENSKMPKNTNAGVKRKTEVGEEIKDKSFKAESLAEISTDINKGT